MHVLHVIPTLSPAAGGPPESVRQLAAAYQKAGHSVEVLCADRPEDSFLKDMPCKVHALGPSYVGRYSFSIRLWRWLHAHASNYNAIVMNGIWTFPGVAVRVAARNAGCPYGIFIHGALDPWFNKKYPLKHVKKLIYWPIQHAVLRDATAVFFTSETESELARQSFRPHRWKSVVVPYGIGDPHDAESRPREAAGQIEKFYDLLPEIRGKRYLLFLGRIHEKKGCDLLIKAFARQSASIPGIHVVVAGPDQVGLQARLQAMSKTLGISDRVHWPGQLRGDLKWGALRACEAFMLPSHQENFGIAVVEALAVGRPVLISNQVNIWQDIVADRVGLVDEDTLEGTERLLQSWCTLPEDERAEIALRGRQSFLSRYSIARTVDAINDAISPRRAQLIPAGI